MPGNAKNKIDALIKKYELRQDRLIRRTLEQIMLLFDNKATEIAFMYAARKLVGNRFLPRDVRETIERSVLGVNAKVKDVLIRSIKTSFDNSNEKNDIVEKTASNGRRIPPGLKTKIAAAAGSGKGTITAVDEFIKRKTQGLNLSQRVFKLSNSYKKAINDTMIDGLGKGTSARDLAKDMRKNLRNNKFQEHPGRGVYRSPMKNAMRLTRNENNLAYASADFERWQLVESIVGIEVKLSNRHPKYDMCDELDGVYPKTFRFSMWHVNCLCIAVPMLADQKTRDAIMDYKLGLIERPPRIKRIEEIPNSAKQWIEKNHKRVDGWKSQPYWWNNNKATVEIAKDPEALRRFNTTAGLEKNIALAKESGKDTFRLYRDNEGNWLPFREDLHDKYIDGEIAKGSTKTGTVYMMGGAPANGKSALVDAGVLPHPKGILTLNPDKIKEALPEYNLLNNRKDFSAAAFAHEESSYLSKQITRKALAKNFDILSDGVADGKFEEFDKKLQQFRDAGKRIRADYVSLDTDLSVRIETARAKKTGRKVPKDYLLDMNKEISILVPKLIENKSLDELYLWDTNLEGKPRLILQQIDGKLTIFNQQLYNRFLRKAK